MKTNILPIESNEASQMEKKEDEQVTIMDSGSNVLKEPTDPPPNDENKDQVFRTPIINLLKLKNIKRKCSKWGRNKYYSDQSVSEEVPVKKKKFKRRSKKKAHVELASDKNIATLLRSERLADIIKSGCNIPYTIAYNISVKTGFKSVTDLNDYISAHRNKFIVLVDRKEKNCQNESDKCNTPFKRSDSVDLNLYFKHHYGNEPDENQSSSPKEYLNKEDSQ